MDWINIALGLFFVFLGFLVKAFPNLIAGYNTMPKAKKAQVDIDGLSSFIRNVLIIIGLFIIISYFILNSLKMPAYTDWTVIFIIVTGTLIILIGAQKYDHNKK